MPFILKNSLLYKEDFLDARERLSAWWHGEDIGRPVIFLYAPRDVPFEYIPPMEKPKGWLTNYSTSNFEYRVNLAARACIYTNYYGEAIPHVAPDLAPNCLALYLGCRGIEEVDTVWCAPCIEDPEQAQFAFCEDNFYWGFTVRLTRELLRIGSGKFVVAFPDLIEGLDTLSAMRSPQKLLVDLYERSEWVCKSLRAITDLYFRYYDILYDLIRDEIGGSIYWIWAPGRVAKLQCDFSAMISPDMFREFMFPVLKEMTERLSYSIYHWDGPAALPHHDHLLNLERLGVIQWTPGTGHELPHDRRWWKYYHKTFEAGKRIYIFIPDDPDIFEMLRKEFGKNFGRFAFGISVSSVDRLDYFLRIISS